MDSLLVGPVLAVRPYTHTDHYWQVYFDANKAIVAVGGEAPYPPIERTLKLRDQVDSTGRPSHVGLKTG